MHKVRFDVAGRVRSRDPAVGVVNVDVDVYSGILYNTVVNGKGLESPVAR